MADTRVKSLQWESNRRLGDTVRPGTAATRWWTPEDRNGSFYTITKDESWRNIYYVSFVYIWEDGELHESKLGMAYSVPEAKKIAGNHARRAA